MDAFEAVIASILQRQGYWTMTSVKVELTKAEKRAIGKHSSPRWELDVVAYRGRDNQILVVECKSYLNSLGVQCAAFDGSKPDAAKGYKLFSDHTLRKVVFRRLKKQLVRARFCSPRPKLRLCLAAGRIHGDQNWLDSHFAKKGWKLFGPDYIQSELEQLKDSGYENSVAAIVTKLLLKGNKTAHITKGVDADG